MKILLAVSAGIDSMYMANRASELFPGAVVAIAHCNFSLRGQESDMDEQFVRQWCAEHGIECHVRRFDTRKYAADNGISIEMAARELRYSWFSQLCIEFGYEAVAVAHNANDNAETLVLNLLRGTGTRGIRGMGERPGVLRPLLGIDREEIHAWMTSHGLPWREDSSNGVNDVKRNIIRNEVFPIFRRINPSFIRTLQEDMKRFAQVDDIAEDHYRSVRDSVLDANGDIRIDRLLELRHWEYVLWRLLEGSGIHREEFNALTDVLRSGRQYAGKTFGPVTAASGRLSVHQQGTEKSKDTEEADGKGEVNGTEADETGKAKGTGDAGSTGKADGSLHWEIIPRSELDALQPWVEGVTLLDADKLSFPLRIRKWQEGDWMRPLGMNGRKKKLSDMFTDLRYSIREKREADVLELDGHHVAALLCRRIDESVKVDASTERVVRLSYRCSMRNTSSPGSEKP